MKNERRKGRIRGAGSFGLIVLLLALIGLFFALKTGIGAASDLINQTTQKTELERVIYPLVIQEPIPFADATKIDKTTIIQSAIWYLFLNEDVDSKYAQDDLMNTLVPSSDVDAAVIKLYGEGLRYVHHTIESNITIKYDVENRMYQIPVIAYGVYTPRVMHYERQDNIYTLTVAYIPPSAFWSGDLAGNRYSANPDKFYTYVLKKVKDGYNILAVKEISAKEQETLMAQYKKKYS